MRDPIVTAEGLEKRFGARAAVDGVSFSVREGECFGFLGPNGAGKTTTIKMITCTAAPSGGTLRVMGLDAVVANHRAIKTRLGIVQQEESLDPDLSIEKNLTMYASYFGMAHPEAIRRAEELMTFASVAERRHDQIRALSGGMKRRLMLARALINDPTLLVLDEPTTGLDPQARRLVWERIRSLRRDGMTILLTTHYMEEASQLCDRLIIMDGGRIVAEGTPAELIARHVGADVIEVYLHGDRSAEHDVAALLETLGDGPWRTERAGEVLYLYLADAAVGLDVLSVLGDREVLHRRATLEDVFLRLTGHALRD
jgi:lipooligosaccharide transport system ATP-binding protein